MENGLCKGCKKAHALLTQQCKNCGDKFCPACVNKAQTGKGCPSCGKHATLRANPDA